MHHQIQAEEQTDEASNADEDHVDLRVGGKRLQRIANLVMAEPVRPQHSARQREQKQNQSEKNADRTHVHSPFVTKCMFIIIAFFVDVKPAA